MRNRLFVHRFFRNGMVLGGALTLALLFTCAALAPMLAPYDPLSQNLEQELRGPSFHNPMGRDKLGRDVMSRIVYGSRVSLKVGLITVAISLMAGTLLGATAGYFGGLWDQGLMRIIDILMAFPGILLAMAMMAILGQSLNNVILALCLVSWVSYARLARGQVLTIREREYIIAARALGASSPRIVCLHILPNILTPLVVESTFGMGAAIVGEAGLSFLGLGVQPPTPSWGSMLYEGRQFLIQAPYLTVFPGLAIMTVVLGINFFGDGLRDALDPKLMGRKT
ncbi:MAG: ABC transporter permease [Deltaproteobacteria bacterium]|nr:ABC transporter permease [Deltaproteobacteria bacterium]MBW2307737.1 ABC transporter permease [Deltaproteobacteria bacterium]